MVLTVRYRLLLSIAITFLGRRQVLATRCVARSGLPSAISRWTPLSRREVRSCVIPWLFIQCSINTVRRPLDIVRHKTRSLLPPERSLLQLRLGRAMFLRLTQWWALTRTWPPLYYVEKFSLARRLRLPIGNRTLA